MIKKNKLHTYISAMSKDQTIETTVWKGLSIIGAALLVGLVSGAFAISHVLNTDHFTLLALNDRVEAIEESLVGKSVFNTTIGGINQRLDTIDKNQQYTNQKLDFLVQQHIK